MSAAAAPRALHAGLGYCDATATASAARRRRSRRLQCCAAYLPFSRDTLCCARRTLERLGYSGKAFLHDFSIRVIGVFNDWHPVQHIRHRKRHSACCNCRSTPRRQRFNFCSSRRVQSVQRFFPHPSESTGARRAPPCLCDLKINVCQLIATRSSFLNFRRTI